MALQPAVCNQCGATLKVDDTDLNGFCKCESCGTSYKIIDVITIDGLPTVKTLLENAEFAIDDNNLEKAEKLYKEVLKIKPNCHEAWWGLYLCNAAFDKYYGYEDKYGNRGPLIKAEIMENTINKFANRAIKNSPPDQAEEYRKIIKKDLEEIDEIRNPKSDPKKEKNGFFKKLFKK